MTRAPPGSTLFPYTTLFRSTALTTPPSAPPYSAEIPLVFTCTSCKYSNTVFCRALRSEEHTSELQSHSDLVCRLLLEKKKGLNAWRGARAKHLRRTRVAAFL